MKKKIKVVVAGCFDLLHLGHLRFFRDAKKHGDRLVVLLARDANIAASKNRHPYFGERERKRLLEELRTVDEVVLGALNDRYSKLLEIRPDVLVLGYDQQNVEDELKEFFSRHKMRVKIIRLKKGLKTGRFKSTKVREHLNCF